MADSEVIRTCNELLKFGLTSEFENSDQGDPYTAVFLQAADKRVRLALEPRPVLKQGPIETERAKWEANERACLLAEEEFRSQGKTAEAAAGRGRAMGEEELALKDEAAARQFYARADEEKEKAARWRQMRKAALPPPLDPRIAKNFANWSLANVSAQNQGCLVEMQKFFWARFNPHPCEHVAIAYTNALLPHADKVTSDTRARSRAAAFGRKRAG
jgi:hypothetical protein